jgi:hypothetical protein
VTKSSPASTRVFVLDIRSLLLDIRSLLLDIRSLLPVAKSSPASTRVLPPGAAHMSSTLCPVFFFGLDASASAGRYSGKSAHLVYLLCEGSVKIKVQNVRFSLGRD